MEYQEEEFENLDTSWIKEYNNIDEIYSDFQGQLETILFIFYMSIVVVIYSILVKKL